MTTEELLIESHARELDNLIETHHLEPSITSRLTTTKLDGDITKAKLAITITAITA